MKPRARRPRHWWLGIALSFLLISAGIAETVRIVRDDAGGLLFWFPTLVGSGVLILVGTLLVAPKPVPGLVLVLNGCVLGILPTMWTLVGPVMLIVLAILTAKQVAAVTQRE